MAKRRTRAQIAADLETDRALVATALAIAGCVLRECPDHKDVWLRREERDIRDAYKVGHEMFKMSGHLSHFFATGVQMEEAVRAAVLRHPVLCPLCEPAKPD
jgi:hypothetical protein